MTAVARWALLRRIQQARRHYCPVCELRGHFLPAGRVARPAARCPNCGALERHRLLWLYLQQHTDLFDGRPKRMLHVAPAPVLAQRLSAAPSLDYVTADLHDDRVMMSADLTAIPSPPGSYDVICCSHVLEHIVDDRAALRELHRVLAPDGWAVLLVPITAESTDEDPSVTDPLERERRFGQSDHVRRYGPDFVDRVEDAGFDVAPVAPADVGEADELEVMGLRGEPLFVCTRAERVS